MSGVFLLALLGVLGLVVLALMGLTPVFPLRARSARVSLFTAGQSPVVTTGDTHTSTTIDSLASVEGIVLGMRVTGPGQPVAATYVTAITNTGTVTLSVAWTATTVGQAVTFTGVGGQFFQTNGANFSLFKADFTPTVNTVLSDLTAIEADFDGYTSKTLAMTVGYVDGISVPYSQSQLLSFVKAAGVATNTIWGWWIDDGVNLIVAGKFNAQAAMTQVGAEVSGIFQDGYPTGTGWVPLIPNNL